MTKDWGGLGGLHNVSVYVGQAPLESRGPRPHPRWMSVGRALVDKIYQWISTCTISVGQLARTCLGPEKFTPGWWVQQWRIARGKGPVLEGPVFLGSLDTTLKIACL